MSVSQMFFWPNIGQPNVFLPYMPMLIDQMFFTKCLLTKIRGTLVKFEPIVYIETSLDLRGHILKTFNDYFITKSIRIFILALSVGDTHFFLMVVRL